MRLFVAICFDEPCKDVLCAAIAGSKAMRGRAIFSRRENLHLTLAFLGETNRIDSAKRALGSIHAESFAMELAGWDAFSGAEAIFGGWRSGKWCADRSPTAGERSAYAGRLFPRKAGLPAASDAGASGHPGAWFSGKGLRPNAAACPHAGEGNCLMESRRVNGLLQYVPRFVQPIG